MKKLTMLMIGAALAFGAATMYAQPEKGSTKSTTGAARGRSGRNCAVLVGLQRARRRREKLTYFVDAGQFLPFRRNLLVLSFSRLHVVDLSDLEVEQLD